VRAGATIWSLGYAYNTNTFAIGTGQATDSNFTAAAAAITITTAGEVQAPLQPSFLAYNATADTGLTTTADVDFDTEVHDTSTDFASDTFTAPVTGRYLFTASVSVQNDTGGGSAKYFEAYFNHSSGPTYYYFGSVEALADGAEMTFSGSIVLSLTAAQTVKVSVGCGAGATYRILGASVGRSTWFSGELLG
jgi:hypothetical protein